MRWIVLWLFLVLRHMPLYAQECDIGDWSAAEKTLLVKDIDDTTILEILDFPLAEKDFTISMCKETEMLVRYELVDKNLQIITQNMRKWESITTNQNSLLIECFNVNFECNKPNRKTINMKIEDTNNYKPKFIDDEGVEKVEYVFTIPMPFPASFSLDKFGSAIMAKDEDYSNTKLTFTVENNDNILGIDYVGSIDELHKVHKGSLVSKVPLDFDEMEFNIKVEDIGDPKDSSSAKLIIKKDPVASLIVPEFDKSYYMGKYDKGGNSNMQDEITLKNAKNVEILVEGEYATYFETKIEEDKIKIVQLKPLDKTNEQNVIFTMKATNVNGQSDEATVIIEPTATNLPKFNKSYYLGKLDIDNKELSHDPILVEADEKATIVITEQELNKIFTIEKKGQTVVITILETANIEDIKDVEFVLPLQITNTDGGTATTIVVLEVIRKAVIPITFSKTNYQGELNVDTKKINMESEIEITEGDADEVKIVEQEYETLFDVGYDQVTKIVSLTVIGNLETIDEPNVVFTLAAYNAKGEMGHTTVVLNVVGDLIKPAPPTFEKTYYEGEFKVEDQSLKLEDIRIDNGDIESVIIVGNDYNTYFEAKYNKDTKLVEIIKLKDLENIMESNIVFSLEASDNYGQSADATVVLKVFGIAEPEEDKIMFDKHEIGFTVEENDILPKEIGPFVATSSNNEDVITYKLIDSIITGIKLNANTGVVSVVDILTDHKLHVKLSATGSISKKIAETEFVIYSYKLQGTTEKATFSYIAKKIKEGDDTNIILQHDNTNYKYCILETNPNDGKISTNKDGHLKSTDLDREDTVFDNIIVPQYLLTVDLVKKTDNCPTPTFQKYNVENINMYDQIENWESRTVVTVLIEDINDNNPVFEPLQQVAYPKEEIAKIIRPMYLTKVHATDLDSDDKFGKITYSCTSDYVYVNGDSGIIYPTDKIFSSGNFEFTVIATDGGGKTDELLVKVSIIDKDKISIISLENIDLESVADKLKELSEQSGINLQALSISAVPVETSMLFNDNSYYAQAYVYGIKDNQIVSSNTIKETINDVTVIEFNPNASDGCDAEIEECDDTGLIAAVAVLAVLLAVVLAGSIAFYVLKLRKHNASSNDFDLHNDAERIFEKTAVPERPNNRRSTGYVFNPPAPEDDDVDSNSNNNEKIGDDFDRNLERRKSVSFNDQIETIKIDKTVPAEETEDSDAKKL